MNNKVFLSRGYIRVYDFGVFVIKSIDYVKSIESVYKNLIFLNVCIFFIIF